MKYLEMTLQDQQQFRQNLAKLVVSRRVPFAMWRVKSNGTAGPVVVGPPTHFHAMPMSDMNLHSHLGAEGTAYQYLFDQDGATLTPLIRIGLLKSGLLPTSMSSDGLDFGDFVEADPRDIWYVRNRSALAARRMLKIQLRSALAKLTRDLPANTWFATYDGQPWISLYLRPGTRLAAEQAFVMAARCIKTAGFTVAGADSWRWPLYTHPAATRETVLDARWIAEDRGFSLPHVYTTVRMPHPEYVEDFSKFASDTAAGMRKIHLEPVPLGSSPEYPGQPTFFIDTDLPMSELAAADPADVVQSVLRGSAVTAATGDVK